MASPGTPFPDHVLLRLGTTPQRADGEDGLVLRGNGCVAKAAPAERLERERFVLGTLAPRLPLSVPALLDAGREWILTDDVADAGHPWSEAELLGCLADLAELHGAFVAHPVLRDSRLADPVGRDLDRLLAEAREAADVVAEVFAPVGRLAADPDAVVDALRAEAPTLLHGDPWPANVRRPGAGRRVWIDWGHAARGPAALDVASWLDQTPWALDGSVDGDAHVEAYLAGRPVGAVRPDTFARALDAAGAFWLLVVDVPRLARAGAEPQLVAEVTAGRRAALERLGFA